MADEPGGLTMLLRRWSDGDSAALGEITALVYKQFARWPMGICGASAPAIRCNPRH